MQNNQLSRFLIISLITLAVLVVVILLLNEQVDFKRSQFMNFCELSFAWVLRFVGLSLLVYSIISLVMAGTASFETKNFVKWIALIMLSMLIMHPAWYFAIALAIIMVTMIVIEYLKSSSKSADTP